MKERVEFSLQRKHVFIIVGVCLAVILLVLMFRACTSKQQAVTHVVGNVTISYNMTISQLETSYKEIIKHYNAPDIKINEVVHVEGFDYYKIGSDIAVVADPNGSVGSITTWSPNYRTPDDHGVGDSLSQILENPSNDDATLLDLSSNRLRVYYIETWYNFLSLEYTDILYVLDTHQLISYVFILTDMDGDTANAVRYLGEEPNKDGTIDISQILEGSIQNVKVSAIEFVKPQFNRNTVSNTASYIKTKPFNEENLENTTWVFSHLNYLKLLLFQEDGKALFVSMRDGSGSCSITRLRYVYEDGWIKFFQQNDRENRVWMKVKHCNDVLEGDKLEAYRYHRFKYTTDSKYKLREFVIDIPVDECDVCTGRLAMNDGKEIHYEYVFQGKVCSHLELYTARHSSDICDKYGIFWVHPDGQIQHVREEHFLLQKRYFASIYAQRTEECQNIKLWIWEKPY